MKDRRPIDPVPPLRDADPSLTRRALLAASAAWPMLSAGSSAAGPRAANGPARSLGLVIHSFAARTAADRDRPAGERFSDPLRFLDHARSMGARGVQVALGVCDEAGARALRERAEAASMYLEGIISLPREQASLDRFEAEVRTAARAGANIVRTVTLSGRRYETFSSADAFRRFADAAEHALRLAGPVVVRQGVLLAVENHKDWRADELLAMLDRIGNDQIGVCLDTGNSMSLLEAPMETIEALAPRAFTTHFKDMAVESYRDGFRLAEVPFGTGVLDLTRAVRVLRSIRPGIRFNVEMITRDPLRVPCLSEKYWTTFPDLPGRHLARMLALVRDHSPQRPLPEYEGRHRDDRIRAEDDNVKRCLDHARDRLGLG